MNWDEFVWSPDGKNMAYKVVDGMREFVILRKSNIVQQGTHYDEIRNLRLSSHGKHLAYIAKSGAEDFLILNNRPIASHARIQGFAFSPNGKRLAYLIDDPKSYHDIVVVDGKPQPWKTLYSHPIVFSPDSRHFAYISRDDQSKRESVIFDGKKRTGL